MIELPDEDSHQARALHAAVERVLRRLEDVRNTRGEAAAREELALLQADAVIWAARRGPLF